MVKEVRSQYRFSREGFIPREEWHEDDMKALWEEYVESWEEDEAQALCEEDATLGRVQERG